MEPFCTFLAGGELPSVPLVMIKVTAKLIAYFFCLLLKDSILLSHVYSFFFLRKPKATGEPRAAIFSTHSLIHT